MLDESFINVLQAHVSDVVIAVVNVNVLADENGIANVIMADVAVYFLQGLVENVYYL